MSSRRTIAEAFAAAWNAHDLDTIMAIHTEDCAFWASAGSEAEGARYHGAAAVRAAYKAIFDLYPDGQWTRGRLTMLEPDRALSEWRFVGTTGEGKRVEVDGLDTLDFIGDRISLKNSYRKQRN